MATKGNGGGELYMIEDGDRHNDGETAKNDRIVSQSTKRASVIASRRQSADGRGSPWASHFL